MSVELEDTEDEVLCFLCGSRTIVINDRRICTNYGGCDLAPG